ncbi:hypothetical protein HK104_000423 [Borealophlyctis nickersoniae]|nr:hypothetical protein HK104_000423 [Borealophlyctis nickersoniae]
MDTFVKDFAKVAKRQHTLAADTTTTIDALITTLTEARNAHASETSPQCPISPTTALRIKTLSTKLSESHKETASSLSRFSRQVEKKFRHDLDSIWDPCALDDSSSDEDDEDLDDVDEEDTSRAKNTKEATLNRTLSHHFIREGRFDLASAFAAEAGFNVPEHLKQHVSEMYTILEQMRKGDVSGAVEWARGRREDLDKRGSGLEFELRKVEFVGLLKAGQVTEALEYAKRRFEPFAGSHLKEIQRLMCSFLFATRLATSPYADLLDPHLQTDIQRRFTRDFCALLGLSSDSPLFISVTVGTHAIPTILKMSSIMKDKSGIEWSQAGELPVEVPLSDANRFHSVFACPVSKEQSTDDNPPMMMACGHVICQDCLKRLGKGSTTTRFKCPYCPTESTGAQAMQIYI